MAYKSAKPTIFPTNIKKVMANRIERAKAAFVINPQGESYWLLKGQKISDKHFNLMFSVEIKKTAPNGYCSRYQNWSA